MRPRARLLLLFAIAGMPQIAQARRYTLPELLAKVRSDYPGVVAARAQVDSAEAQVSQANRLWWPTGTFSFALTGSPQVRCQDVMGHSDMSETVRESNCIQTNAVDLQTGQVTNALPFYGVAFKLDLQLIQPLYTFGKIEAARAAAHAGRDAAHIAVEAAAEDAVLKAVQAYWGLKWARASGATLDDGVSKIGEWVKKIDHEIDTGKSSYTETDLIRLKIALDTAEMARIDVQRAERIALSGIRVLTGEADADIDNEEISELEVTERPISFYEDAARTHRPEARMLDAASEAARAGRKLRLAEMLPDVGILGTFGYSYAQGVDNPTNAFMNHPNSLGAGLYLAIRQQLDIPERLAKYQQARADERALEAKRREALGGIALEIDKAWADLDEARLRDEKTAHGEKIARGWYNAVDQNLLVGTAEARDLVDAARSYFELRLKHLQSIMDLNVALAALKRAAGVE